MAGNGNSRQLSLRYYSDTSLFPGGFPNSTAGSEGVIYVDTLLDEGYLWDKTTQKYVLEFSKDFDPRITNLEDKYETKQLFESISGTTSGSVTTYTNIAISQDNWANQNNAFATETDGGRPSQKTLFTVAGVPITASINALGEYAISGTPTAVNYCIVWLVTGKQVDFATAEIPENKIIEEYDYDSPFVRDQATGDILPEIDGDDLNMRSGGYKDDNVSTAVLLGDASNTSFNTTNKTIIGAVNELEQIRDLTKEPTGFIDPEDVIITGNPTTRTITLSGTVEGYYKGEHVSELEVGWESDPHPNDTNPYFLIYDGSTFQWVTPANFKFWYLQIAFTFFANGSNDRVYARECHGTMPWQSHEEDHDTIGSYRKSGGTLANYVLASTTVAERRPSVSEMVLKDEDLLSTITALSAEGEYTQFSLSSTDTSNFATTPVEIIPLSTNRPYWNEFTGGAWQQTLISNNFHTSVWLLAIPTCACAGSVKYRFVWVQGQTQNAVLSNEQALNTNDVNLGNFAGILPESIFIARVIVKYTGGNWQFIEVENITGNKLSQTSSPSGTFLSVVTSDTTLTGNGTVSDPLGFDLTNPNAWTGLQTFNDIQVDQINIDGSIIESAGLLELKGAVDSGVKITGMNDNGRLQIISDLGVGSLKELVYQEYTSGGIVANGGIQNVYHLNNTALGTMDLDIATQQFLVSDVAENQVKSYYSLKLLDEAGDGFQERLNLDHDGAFDLPTTGSQYEIGGTSVLNADTLGANIVNSSLTSVGTLGSLDVANNITVGGTVDGIDIGTDVPLNTTHRGSAGIDHSDVVLNNTHRTSNGTNHTYIDQDVKTTADVEHNDLNLTGVFTAPNHPCFSAHLGTATGGVIGGSAGYTAIYDTERYDQSSSYNTSTGIFTAPVGGRFSIKTITYLATIGSDNNDCSIYLVTSNFVYRLHRDDIYKNIGAGGAYVNNSSMDVDMDSGDTAYISINCNGTVRVVLGGGGSGGVASHFSVFLIA